MHVHTLTVGPLQTNCYLVYNEQSREALIIDAAADAPRILKTVETLSLRVTSVVLTHAHFDHMMAAKEVCETLGAPLCVGVADADLLADSRRNLSAYFQSGHKLSLTADRLLQEGDTLAVGQEHLTVWQTSGHTPGGICLVDDEVLFSGDTLFAGSVGRTDFHGGDVTALRRSLRRLATITGDRQVYPGHGAPTTLADERANNPYMTEET